MRLNVRGVLRVVQTPVVSGYSTGITQQQNYP
jgi:hypothetical protein